jgi:hypothetical protein
LSRLWQTLYLFGDKIGALLPFEKVSIFGLAEDELPSIVYWRTLADPNMPFLKNRSVTFLDKCPDLPQISSSEFDNPTHVLTSEFSLS